MTRLKLSGFRVSFLVILCLSLLYLATSRWPFVRNLETAMLDLRFQARGTKEPGSHITLVLIDDTSIRELGRWPWSRSRFAEIVQRLRALGARVIAFDLLFTEPEIAHELDVWRSLRGTFDALGLVSLDPKLLAFRQVLLQEEAAADPDLQFARALQEAGNVVLPLSFTYELSPSSHMSSQTPAPSFMTRAAYRAWQYQETEKPSLPLVGAGLLAPLENIGQSAKALAHANVAFDTDGTPRYEFPVVEYQGEYYPSLPIQVVREYLGFQPEAVKLRFGRGIQLGHLFIPTDEQMRLLVNCRGPEGIFPTYSFVDVLQGRFPDAAFRDKVVLIGGGAAGIGDTFATPFSKALPSTERYAHLIDSILQEDFLRRDDATGLLDLLCIIALGVGVGLVSPVLPSFWGSIFALGMGGGFLALNLLAFTRAGIWVNLLFPLLAVLLTQSAVTLFQFLTEERQKRMIRGAFQHYLHPSLVDQLSKNPDLLTLGGVEREVTVLFSDIRDFSSIAEQLTPAQLVHLLNEYFTAMTELVLHENGCLDKYIGDGVMAVYGAPLDAPDHADRACRTALQMLTTLGGLQQRWEEGGLPRIGIHTGSMVVGNMGSELRFDYTVMGDGVNLASRLEGGNKEYRTQIIMSESTWERVKDRIAARELDVIRVKGKTQTTRIFEVLGFDPLPPARLAMVTRFEEALHAYRARQWERALHLFTQTLAKTPEDYPSQLYRERCKAYISDPPAPDWDGVYMMQSK